MRTQEVLVGGFTAGEGRRTATFGSLLLGAYDADGALRYLGHVGTGFSDAVLVDLMARLRPLARPTSPFDEVVPREHARKARWVEPVLVGEVEYRLVTRDGRLRHAAWRGLRPDRAPDVGRMPAVPADARPRRTCRRDPCGDVPCHRAVRSTGPGDARLARRCTSCERAGGGARVGVGARRRRCRWRGSCGPGRRWSARC